MLKMKSSIFMVFLIVLGGCNRVKPVGLDLFGYNYTNRYISSYSVTGQSGHGAWGGDVDLSTPTIGGGKDTCCIMLDTTYKKPVSFLVSWHVGAVGDSKRRIIAEGYDKDQWIEVKPPYPKDAQYFEVHFYPDGHVEAAITHYASPPRIILPIRQEHL